MNVTFGCGHRLSIAPDKDPICGCGNRKVVRVDAPRPTFRGIANGPCARYEDLPGQPVTWRQHDR